MGWVQVQGAGCPLPGGQQVGCTPLSLWVEAFSMIHTHKEKASLLGYFYFFSFVFTVGINKELQCKENPEQLLVYCLIQGKCSLLKERLGSGCPTCSIPARGMQGSQ